MTETTTEQVDASAATEPAGGWDAAIAASAEAQAEPTLARKTVRRLVRWKLEAPAMADLGRELAQESADLEAIKAERKSVNAHLRARSEEVETKIKGLTEAIRSGVGTREVECYERFDPDTGRTELVSLDGTILEEAADVEAGGRQLTLADAARNGSNGHAAAPFVGSTCASCDVELTEENGRRNIDGDALCVECHAREAEAETEADDDDSAEDLDEDDESPDLEDRLDRALAESDAADAAPLELPAWAKETTPYEGRKTDDEPSSPAIDDPAAVLAAAETSADADTSADAPAPKRARKGRKS